MENILESYTRINIHKHKFGSTGQLIGMAQKLEINVPSGSHSATPVDSHVPPLNCSVKRNINIKLENVVLHGGIFSEAFKDLDDFCASSYDIIVYKYGKKIQSFNNCLIYKCDMAAEAASTVLIGSIELLAIDVKPPIRESHTDYQKQLSKEILFLLYEGVVMGWAEDLRYVSHQVANPYKKEITDYYICCNTFVIDLSNLDETIEDYFLEGPTSIENPKFSMIVGKQVDKKLKLQDYIDFDYNQLCECLSNHRKYEFRLESPLGEEYVLRNNRMLFKNINFILSERRSLSFSSMPKLSKIITSCVGKADD